jgi:acyl-CoA reductase-like NAD-dependent aldehyde dehydrogenase
LPTFSTKNDDFRQKALEGFAMFLLNQGEVCTCPSRALIDRKIYGTFMELAVERAGRVSPGDPLDTATKLGAQASNDRSKRFSRTSTSAKRRARSFDWAASACVWAAIWRRATTWRRRSSKETTR